MQRQFGQMLPEADLNSFSKGW